MIITDFVMSLQEELEKRNMSESSILQYIKVLLNLYKKIHGNEKLNSLKFLKDLELIEKTIKENYKETSQKNIYNILRSILYPHKEKKGFKNVYDFYKEKSEDINKEIIKNVSQNKKTDTQEKNWITWDEVKKIQDDLKTETNKIISKKNIGSSEYETLLKNVVLHLYTELPPRRNEYQHLLIVPNSDDLDDNKNYYVKDEGKFILNNYKTSKKYGKQIIEVPDNLTTAINNYLQYHTLFNASKKKKNYEIPFLVNKSGVPLTQVNSLTRLLNKIFKKNIGASMLRHIYLSDKYGEDLEEMKEDSKMMGHSLGQQKEYIKKD